MSKQVRNIIIAVISLLVLVGALIAVIFLLKDKDNDDSSGSESSSSKTESHTVVDKSADSDTAVVKAIVFSGYKIVEEPKGENSDSSDSADKTEKKRGDAYNFTVKLNEDDSLVVEGFEKLPIETSATTTLGTALGLIEASRKFENVTLSEYGLDNPLCKLTVTYHDDSVITINIGNETPTQNGYYISVNDEKTAYLVTTAKAEAMIKKDTDFIATSLVTAPEVSEGQEVIVRNLELSGTLRKNKPVNIRVVSSEDPAQFLNYSHVISGTVLLGTNDVTMTAVAAVAASLTADSAYIGKPSGDDLKAAGLDNPHSVGQITLAVRTTVTEGEKTTATFSKDKTYTVKLGKKNEDGQYYAMIDDINVIYLVAAEAVPWAEKTYNDFAAKNLFLINIKTVDSFRVKEGDRDVTFKLKHDNDETDGEKNLVITADGKTYNTTSFRTLYQVAMGISRHQDFEGEISKEPIATIEVATNDGKVWKANFYSQSANVVTCEVVGVEVYSVTFTKYTDFITAFSTYLEGE